jgi:hypothetical protein
MNDGGSGVALRGWLGESTLINCDNWGTQKAWERREGASDSREIGMHHGTWLGDPSNPRLQPHGPLGGIFRVLRGPRWAMAAQVARLVETLSELGAEGPANAGWVLRRLDGLYTCLHPDSAVVGAWTLIFFILILYLATVRRVWVVGSACLYHATVWTRIRELEWRWRVIMIGDSEGLMVNLSGKGNTRERGASERLPLPSLLNQLKAKATSEQGRFRTCALKCFQNICIMCLGCNICLSMPVVITVDNAE